MSQVWSAAVREKIIGALQQNERALTIAEIAQSTELPVGVVASEINVLWEPPLNYVSRQGGDKWILAVRVNKQAVAPPLPPSIMPIKLAPVTPQFFLVKEVVEMAKSGRLNLHPYFQRGVVWNEDAQGYLVSTLLKGRPILEAFLWDNPAGTLDVMDGQQKLTSVIKFAQNELFVVGYGKFRQLSPMMQRFVLEFPLQARVIGKDVPDTEVRAIFRALNTNVYPLSPQELRHAEFTGPFIRLVDKLAKDPYWTEMRIISPTEAKRMKLSEYVSELLVGMKEGPQDGRYHLTEWYETYESEWTSKTTETWEARFLRTHELIKELTGTVIKNRWRAKHNMYALFVAVYGMRSSLKASRMKDASQRLATFIYEFGRQVDMRVASRPDFVPSEDPLVISYAELQATGGFDSKASREQKVKIMRVLLEPFCQASP